LKQGGGGGLEDGKFISKMKKKECAKYGYDCVPM
jgi:hypothetical protein